MKKRFEGRVVSDKMQKTVVVQIERRVMHPLYKKYITKRKKLACHDPKEIAHEGDWVLIEECRPISKTKHFRVVKILRRAGEEVPEPEEVTEISEETSEEQ